MAKGQILWVALLGTTACTAGRVQIDGQAAAGATVILKTCSQNYQTTTDGSGTFAFNPYSATSANLDLSKYVGTGPMLITVSTSNVTRYKLVQHAYDQTCSTTVNGAAQNVPCHLYDVDLSTSYDGCVASESDLGKYFAACNLPVEAPSQNFIISKCGVRF